MSPIGDTLSNRPGATQKYYGVDFSVVKRLSDHWMLRGNFGWNSFKQYLNASSIQDPNNLWALGGQNCGNRRRGRRASRPAIRPRIRSSSTRSWQFNVNALYQGPFGLDFGVNFFGRQGYRESLLRPDAGDRRRGNQPQVPTS